MTEFELINLLTRGAPKTNSILKMGVGDDCAVFGGDKFDWLVTTDALFEGVHFNLADTTCVMLGRKALTVNLSDIAAMGGEPLFYTVALGIPKGFSVLRLKGLYKGMSEAAGQCVLVGGDTNASKSGLVISISVIGCVEKGKAVFRSNAKSGDLIYVTGTLGDSALGFYCLKNKKTKNQCFIKKFNNPTARLDIGKWLASSELAAAMIDISDGVLSDLGHIASASMVGYKIYAEKIPFSKGFAKLALALGKDPIEIALTGGEDYELLFTVRPKNAKGFDKLVKKRGYKITLIGEILPDPKKRVVLNKKGNEIKFRRVGFDHFER